VSWRTCSRRSSCSRSITPGAGSSPDRLTAELVRHTVAEERHLYPAVREHVPHGAALADKELADHARVEQMLRDLENLSVDDPQFNDTIAKLKFEVASHVREEEHELFPKLAAALPPEKLNELGRLVHQARETAPTRPQPWLPNTPPAHTARGVRPEARRRLHPAARAGPDHGRFRYGRLNRTRLCLCKSQAPGRRR
jgi:hemerythrin superfamily protein